MQQAMNPKLFSALSLLLSGVQEPDARVELEM